jgi:ABC-2 type transport system ATP-binding protein
VTFANSVAVDELRSVEGVQSVDQHGPVIELTVVGSADPIIKALARHEVVSLTSEEPDLEDLVLAFYGDSDA